MKFFIAPYGSLLLQLRFWTETIISGYQTLKLTKLKDDVWTFLILLKQQGVPDFFNFSNKQLTSFQITH